MSAFNKYADPKVRMGLPASELWGVSQGPKRRKRSERAAARRRAKRAAAGKNVTLKSYLRRRV